MDNNPIEADHPLNTLFRLSDAYFYVTTYLRAKSKSDRGYVVFDHRMAAEDVELLKGLAYGSGFKAAKYLTTRQSSSPLYIRKVEQ